MRIAYKILVEEHEWKRLLGGIGVEGRKILNLALETQRMIARIRFI
jgi:hypothetical protein